MKLIGQLNRIGDAHLRSFTGKLLLKGFCQDFILECVCPAVTACGPVEQVLEQLLLACHRERVIEVSFSLSGEPHYSQQALATKLVMELHYSQQHGFGVKRVVVHTASPKLQNTVLSIASLSELPAYRFLGPRLQSRSRWVVDLLGRITSVFHFK